jgi:hypothetical protein
MMKRWSGLTLSFFLLVTMATWLPVVCAQESKPAQTAAPLKAPDERYKVDILLVVAHPDDEGAATAYLARAIDEGKRVAVVYGTRGSSGANEVGAEPFVKLRRDARFLSWASGRCGFSTAKTPLRKMCCNRFPTGIMVRRCSNWCG